MEKQITLRIVLDPDVTIDTGDQSIRINEFVIDYHMATEVGPKENPLKFKSVPPLLGFV